MKIKWNDKVLGSLERSFVSSKKTANVGVLSNKSHTSDNGKSIDMVKLAAIHEFGTKTIPERSFLRLTAFTKAEEYRQFIFQSRADIFKEITAGNFESKVLPKVAIWWVGKVLEAFASRGFGKWRPWASGYSNNTGMILVDTQQLRNSISYQVVDK